MTEALEPPPDAELIKAVRAGDVSAFGVLYERHLVAATRAAGCLASTRAEREDLVAEAFTRVLRVLREGRGPNEEFRPYLLVTMRNMAISGASRGVPVSLYADVPDVSPAGGADGRVIDRWDASAAAEAFASLPERWRVVLWHTEVENEPPASVARLLGMRPNSVAALAYRAREGLRQAYLRMHAPEPPRRECRSTVDKLAGYVRRNVPLPLSRKIGKHLHGCPDCRARADTLGKINSELRGLLGPIVLGAPLAAAYLPAPAVTGAVSGALGASMASGTALAVASEVASSTVSGVLAMKATLVQVAAALAVTTTAATVATSASSDPATPPPRGELPAAALSLPAATLSTATLTVRPSPYAAPLSAVRSTAPAAPERQAAPVVPATAAPVETAPPQKAKKAKKDKKDKGEKAKKDRKK